MFALFINFLDTIAKADEDVLKVYKEGNCLLNSYNAARVFVPPQVLMESLYKGLKEKVLKLPMWEDALLLEELNYRARIYVVTNFDKATVKEFLVKNNLDAFVQGVIDASEAKRYKPSREFFEYAAKVANAPVQAITLFSSNPADVMVGKSLGMRAIWLNRRNEAFPFPANLQPSLVLNSITRLAEITAERKVDSRMGDSALRCT